MIVMSEHYLTAVRVGSVVRVLYSFYREGSHPAHSSDSQLFLAPHTGLIDRPLLIGEMTDSNVFEELTIGSPLRLLKVVGSK